MGQACDSGHSAPWHPSTRGRVTCVPANVTRLTLTARASSNQARSPQHAQSVCPRCGRGLEGSLDSGLRRPRVPL
jgi:hypothetical protein